MPRIHLTEDDLNLHFPDPGRPLLEGPGPSVSWSDWMDQTAAQTIYYLKHFGHLPPPPPPEAPFRFDTSLPSPASRRAVDARLSRLRDALPPSAALSASALMRRLGLRHRSNFRARYLKPALQAGLIERTHPSHPSSPRQRYRRAAVRPPRDSIPSHPEDCGSRR